MGSVFDNGDETKFTTFTDGCDIFQLESLESDLKLLSRRFFSRLSCCLKEENSTRRSTRSGEIIIVEYLFRL